MNTIFKKFRWLAITLCSLAVALGILVIVLAFVNYEIIGNLITIVAAVALMGVGLLLIGSSLLRETQKAFTSSLVYGSFAITIGIVLLVGRFAGDGSLLVEGIIVYLFAIFLISYGVAALAKAVTLIVYHAKVGMIILNFVLATIGIAAGILSLCYLEKTVWVAYLVLGIAMIVLGIVGIVKSAQREKGE